MQIGSLFKVEAILSWNDNEDVEVKLEIQGRPVAQPRPRAMFQGGRFHFYSPGGIICHYFKQEIAQALSLQHLPDDNGQRSIFGPNDEVRLVVEFCVMNRRKDIDNLLKFLLDGLQRHVLHDDFQVVMVKATKKRVETRAMEGYTITLSKY